MNSWYPSDTTIATAMKADRTVLTKDGQRGYHRIACSEDKPTEEAQGHKVISKERANDLQLREELKKKATPNVVLNVLEV